MLNLRQLNKGNAEKDCKTLLISYEKFLQNILLRSPFRFFLSIVLVKKSLNTADTLSILKYKPLTIAKNLLLLNGFC